MTIFLRSLGLVVFCTAWSSIASAQTPSSTTSQTSSGTPIATRVATTTFSGDTGLWFVPTAEVLPAKKWSASFYRRGTNFAQGFTNVGDFAGTFAVGIRDRAEIFGSFLVITRVDRDLRPLFVANPAEGGVVDRYPYMNTTWWGTSWATCWWVRSSICSRSGSSGRWRRRCAAS